MTVGGTVRGTYVYNGFEQLISRVITNSGTANGTTYFVHDQWGNVIAELTTAGATVREYIWLPETEIAPTMASRTQVDRPVAVVDGVNTASPATLMVHVDHLNRPVRMTNSAKASVWDVIYTPWGAFHSATGAQTLNARFPGQWFQLESGLHYNWHRAYDPSLGRYTQPDPLGFVDGPSVYAYAGGSPHSFIDKDGRVIPLIIAMCEANPSLCLLIAATTIEIVREYMMMCMASGDPKKDKDKTQTTTQTTPSPSPPDDCKKEWDAAYEKCTEWLQSDDPPRRLTGGYITLPECARGLVSARCGGNKVEWPKTKRSKRYGPF